MQQRRMVLVASAPNEFAARVIAARLGSEGIVTELRGVDATYPVGEVSVLVDTGDLETAREILLVEEIESAFDHEGDDDGPLSAPPALWLVVATVAVLAMFGVARLFV